MCDNLPNISADQLTRAVAGTLSALDAPDEDEYPTKPDETLRGKAFQNHKAGKKLEKSKSSLQLLESLSASIDPNKSKLQELNEAHLAYTPSTSFYGRARKMTNKKKALEDAKSKPQAKKYSSRKNYKLSPPQLPNHVQMVKVSPVTQSGQTVLQNLTPGSLPIGTSSMKPVFVLQSSQIVPFLSTSSVATNSANTFNVPKSPSRAGSLSSVMSNVTASQELTLIKTTISGSPTFTVSPPANNALSCSPQSQTFKTSVTSVTNLTKSPAPRLITLSHGNSVIQLPTPLISAPSHCVSTNIATSNVVRRATCAGSETNVVKSSAPVNVQSDSVTMLRNQESPFGVLTKAAPSVISPQGLNKNAISTSSASNVNEIIMKSIMSPNHLHSANISPSSTNWNSRTQATYMKGQESICHVNLSSFPSSETQKATQSLSQGLLSPNNKPLTLAGCPQIAPRIGGLNSLSHSSCGPILVLPSQNIQLPLKLTNANQVVLSVQPSSVSVSASSNTNLISSVGSRVSQISPVGRPSSVSKLGQQTCVVSSNRSQGQISHPNIVKLLQSSSMRETSQVSKSENITSSAFSLKPAVNSFPVTSEPLSLRPVAASSDIPSDFSKTASTAIYTVQPPPKPVSPTLTSGAVHKSSCSPSSSASLGISHCMSKPSNKAMSAVVNVSASSHATLLVNKPVTTPTPRMQLTIVTDPIFSKQNHTPQTCSNTRPPQVYTLPRGNVISMDQKSTSLYLPKSSAAVISPGVKIITTSSEKINSQTTSYFTSPISTSVSQPTKKETLSANPINTQSKSLDSNFLLSKRESASTSVSTGSDGPLKQGIPVSSVVTKFSARVSVPAIRFSSSSVAGGSVRIPTPGSRLILSPAGISQLQTLMRSKGMSEGYFVISAKRGASALPVNKDMSIKRPCLPYASTSSDTTTFSASFPSSSLISLSSSPISSTTLSRESAQPKMASLSSAGSFTSTLSSSRSVVKTPTSVAIIANKDILTSSIPTCPKIAPMTYSEDKRNVASSVVNKRLSDIESFDKDDNEKEADSQKSSDDESDDRDGDSDDESLSSTDSESSSVALVIETNYDSDQKRTDNDTPCSETTNGCSIAKDGDQSEKETPLNLSKSILTDTSEMVAEKVKSNVSYSPEAVHDIDGREKDTEGFPQSPHDTSCNLLDSMRGGNFCVPQSPLSLTEIIRQQQCKFGVCFPPISSPQFIQPNKETLPPIHGASTVTGDKADSSTISYASSGIPFSMSDSCSSTSYAPLLSQHTVTDQHAVYERSLNTPHSFYPHDLMVEDHVHDSSDLEAAMNLQRLRECLPPMSSSQMEEPMTPSVSMSASATSPKSPLLLSSMHQMEGNANINPPMTPNTMLINLLNRVPTPLLTNPQDLLTNPSSQENEIRLVENEHVMMDPSSNKENGHQLLEKSFAGQKVVEGDMPQQTTSGEAMFDTSPSKIIPSDSDVFAHPQNALDLIASNYLPPQSKEEMITSSNVHLGSYSEAALPENLANSSKSCQQDLYSNCVTSNMPLSGQDYCMNHFTSTLPSSSHQHCYHASSCPGPLTVTVNLDGDTFAGSNSNNTVVTHQETTTVSVSGYGQGEICMEQESLTGNFSLHSNDTQEKCGEAEILRHLIQNTNTSCQSHLNQQPPHSQQFIGLHFDSTAGLFTPQIHDHQFESEMTGSFMHLNETSAPLQKNLACSGPLFDSVSLSQNISFSMPVPQDSSMETYSHLDNGTLQATASSLNFSDHSSFEDVQMRAETNLQTNSFNNEASITAFESNPDTSFERNANATFQTNPDPNFRTQQNDPSFQSEANGAFIMSNSLSDIQTSFEGNLEKTDVVIQSKFVDHDNQKIHLSGFREDGEQNEMFFSQSDPSQSQSQSAELHLYDMGSMHHSSHEMHHSSHDIPYQIPALQDHQPQLDSHQGVVPQVPDSSLPQNVLAHQHDLQSHQHDLQTHHPKDIQSHHYSFQGQASHQFPESSAPAFSDHQGDIGGYIQEPSFPHFYDNSVGPDMPLYSQHCAVGSEAPMLMSMSNLNCPIPPFSTASDLQFSYHAEEASNGDEKHPVLPSASFSPPSVADQAVTPDSGNMILYNGSFQNTTVYDMYVRGGNTESRSQLEENPVVSGNFCVECNIMYKTQCKFHPCDYVCVTDMPILSHARLTLPACLKLSVSSVHGHTNTMGVFVKEKLSAKVKFGPLIGSMVSCDKLGSTRSFSLWQTFSNKNVRVIDTSDENSSNWLMFVKPARVSAEQNLVAFQHGNNIYFVTRCQVEEGKELLYWFSKDYARMLGMTSKPKSAQHQLCPHCHVCKQVFADRKQVRNHIRLQHPKPHVNKCSHCSRRFSQVSHLNAHVMAIHLRLKKFICNHCGKRFNDSSNLRKHIKSHSEERNFKCQMCGKAFRQKAHLQIHMNTHMPVKHEQCGFCGERFTRAFERKQHELQHTKQHKIECQHCSKVFYKQKIYKEHLKIHRNERNFPCLYCGKAFRNKFALTRHGPACKQRKRTLPIPPTSTESLPSMHGSSAS